NEELKEPMEDQPLPPDASPTARRMRRTRRRRST
nr:hypothetical protein [Tanacetum cinerariifolium]